MGITLYEQAHLVSTPFTTYAIGWAVGRSFYIDDIYANGMHMAGLSWAAFENRCHALGIVIPDPLHEMIREE